RIEVIAVVRVPHAVAPQLCVPLALRDAGRCLGRLPHGRQAVEVIEAALEDLIRAFGEARGRRHDVAAPEDVDVRHRLNLSVLAVVSVPGVETAGGRARDEGGVTIGRQGVGKYPLVGAVDVDHADAIARPSVKAESLRVRELRGELSRARDAELLRGAD